jgi:hypothetical protein
MFLVFLLLVVLLSLSVKEGMDAKEKTVEMYENYKKIDEMFKGHSARFKSLVM